MPNADLEKLTATVEALQRKVKDLEDRPVLREERFIESAPKWLQAVVGLATLILVPTLSWGAVQLYGLNGDLRALQADVRAIQVTLRDLKESDKEHASILREHGSILGKQTAALGRIEALLAHPGAKARP